MDLILDIWIAPDNSIRILDEEEFEEAKQKNLLTSTEVSIIEKQKKEILAGYKSFDSYRS